MKRKNPQDVLAKKRTALVLRTAAALRVSEAEAQGLLMVGRQQSLRLNPLVADAARTLERLRALGWQGERYPWLSDGYTVDTAAAELRDSDVVAEGAVFIQNAASWLPVLALDARPGDEVLDVCAAPGGKTSHIAARTANQALITANDNSRPRLMKLQATCQRLGVEVGQFTLYDAQKLARKMEGRQFDRILIDAPCSGEGLMRLDRDKDFTSWSVAHIKRLQQLQKRIVVQAWQLLKPGGTLVYSTCTMAPEEDEAVVDYILRALDDVEVMPLAAELQAIANVVPAVGEWNGRTFSSDIRHCLRLKPSPSIEAFFVCRLRKLPGEADS